jgi:hypothetical protein
MTSHQFLCFFMSWRNRDGTGRSRAAGSAGRTPRRVGAVGQPTAGLLIKTAEFAVAASQARGCRRPFRSPGALRTAKSAMVIGPASTPVAPQGGADAAEMAARIASGPGFWTEWLEQGVTSLSTSLACQLSGPCRDLLAMWRSGGDHVEIRWRLVSNSAVLLTIEHEREKTISEWRASLLADFGSEAPGRCRRPFGSTGGRSKAG